VLSAVDLNVGVDVDTPGAVAITVPVCCVGVAERLIGVAERKIIGVFVR